MEFAKTETQKSKLWGFTAQTSITAEHQSRLNGSQKVRLYMSELVLSIRIYMS